MKLARLILVLSDWLTNRDVTNDTGLLLHTKARRQKQNCIYYKGDVTNDTGLQTGLLLESKASGQKKELYLLSGSIKLELSPRSCQASFGICY